MKSTITIELSEEDIQNMEHVFQNYRMTMDETLAMTGVADSAQLTEMFKAQRELAQKLWDKIETQVEEQ